MDCHVCPYWIGYFLINPFRKYVHNPQEILGKYIKPGMKVIDYGCAMGYFSLPMAGMVGESGKVLCFDVQDRMLNKLNRRARRAGVSSIIEPVLVNHQTTVFDEIRETADFALLFAVVHEVPDKEMLFTNLHTIMKRKSLLLIAEPAGHVSLKEFKKSVSLADDLGFDPLYPVEIKRSHAILMERT